MLIKGVPKKCKNRFCVKMGLPIKNYHKTDPPKPYMNFQKTMLNQIYFIKFAHNVQKIALKRTKIKNAFFLFLGYWLNY